MTDLTPLEEIVVDPYNVDYLLLAYRLHKSTEVSAAVIDGLDMIINNNEDIIECKGLIEDEERIEAEENLEKAVYYTTLLHREGLEAYISELRVNKSEYLKRLLINPYDLSLITQALLVYDKEQVVEALKRGLKLQISIDADESLDYTLSDLQRTEAEIELNLDIYLLKVLEQESFEEFLREIAKTEEISLESIN